MVTRSRGGARVNTCRRLLTYTTDRGVFRLRYFVGVRNGEEPGLNEELNQFSGC